MDGVYVPLLSGLLGAIIGSTTSIVTIVVQARYAARQTRARLAVEAAIEDHKGLLEIAKGLQHQGRKVLIAPLGAAVLFHADLLEALEGAGRLTPDDLRELYSRHERLRAVMEEASNPAYSRMTTGGDRRREDAVEGRDLEV